MLYCRCKVKKLYKVVEMSLEKNIRLGQLFDAYGKLLSKNQFEVMDDFINNDLTLTEVAENRNITRQAVKDMVSKVEKKLEEFESKLHFCQRIRDMQKQIDQLKGER